MYQLYHGARNYCDQSVDTILMPVSNWNHDGAPMKKKSKNLILIKFNYRLIKKNEAAHFDTCYSRFYVDLTQPVTNEVVM